MRSSVDRRGSNIGSSRGGRETVAIVFWEGYLGVAPSLINAARRLAETGFTVEIFTRAREDDFAPPPDLGPSITVRTALRRATSIGKLDFVWSRLSFLSFVLRWSIGIRYRFVMGVDMNGLIVALPLSKWKRCSLLHWSLEINPLPSASRLARLSSWFRLRAYRAAEVTVTQDAHRAASLARLSGVPTDSIVRIANGPMGPVFRERSTWMQEHLGLDASQKIAIHIGMLSETVMSRQLASEARSWAEDWLLVFHERQRRDPDDPYLQEVRQVGGNRIALSLEPVGYDELDPLVASAAVGLLLYDRSVGLTYSMPGSSGKLGQYLKCGVPVVALDLPGLPEVIEGFGCGICVSTVEEIGSAIERIDADRERFRENAFRCYEEAFEFSRQFDALLQSLLPVT